VFKKFVVCIDSIGQDREFTQEQKEFALKAVYRFRKHWEEFENQKLIADRDALWAERKDDAEKFNEERVAEIKQKEETLVEQFLNPEAEEESKEPEDPKAKLAKNKSVVKEAPKLEKGKGVES